MSKSLPLLLHAIASDDGKRCAPECPHYYNPSDDAPSDYEVEDQPFCLLPTGRELDWAEDDSGWMRTSACVELEQAAREAEVAAMREGFEIARDNKRLIVNEAAGVAPYPTVLWGDAYGALDKAIEAKGGASHG